MSSEKKHLTLFFISVFLHFVSCQCMNSFCLYFDSRRIHELDFLLQRLACSSLTPRWFIEALRCINDLVHSEFPISALPCCTVLIMISARVIGLRSVESDVFYNSWPAEKCKNFLHQRHLLYKWRRMKDIGCCMDTTEHRRTPTDHGDKTQA